MQEKVFIMGIWCGEKNPSLGITVRHHEACRVMPISDPRDRIFYPYHTSMKDTHNFCHDTGPVALQFNSNNLFKFIDGF